VILETGDQPLFEETEEEEEAESEEDEEEAERMQLSTLSFNCSSSNSDTPRGHKRHRSAQRKNLSQSFSANLEEEEDQAQEAGANQQAEPPVVVVPQQGPRIPLYRTDSGFNETSSTSTFACSQDLPLDAVNRLWVIGKVTKVNLRYSRSRAFVNSKNPLPLREGSRPPAPRTNHFYS